MHNVQRVLRSKQLISTASDSSVFDTVARMTDAGVGAIAVMAGDRLVGMFSERDLMTRVVVPGRDAKGTRVGDVMSRDVVTGSLNDTRAVAVAKMRKAGCRHLPVVVEGRVIGMLSMRDLLRDEIEEQGEEIANLRAYLYQTPLS